MADILNIGIRGMLAYQAALAITSGNIGNVKTPFYSRREIVFAEDIFGNGVNIADVRRVYDDSASQYLMQSNANMNMSASYYNQISELESLLGGDIGNESNSTIANFINDALKALKDLDGDTSSIQSRTAYLNKLNSIVSRFNSIGDEIDKKYRLLNQSIETTVNQVNQITQTIADLNEKIINSKGADVSALLDMREGQLQELSKYIDFTTQPDDRGNINILLGDGMPLVFGTKQNLLSTQSDSANPGKLIIQLSTSSSTINVTDGIHGGQLAGLYQSQSLLHQTQNALGRLSLAMMSSMNDQNKLGIDYNGNLGGNIFTDINNPEAILNRVINNTNNTGTAAISVNITDVSKLKTSDYKLVFDTPTHFTVTRLSDNSVVSSGAVGSLPQSIDIDGMSIDINSGTIAAGDQFTISPNRGAATMMKVAITDPKLLALGWPVRADSNINNHGNGSIKVDSILDTSNAAFTVPGQLNPPISIVFLTDSTYQIVNADTNAVIEGPIPYNPSTGGEVFPTPGSYDPGYRISLTGEIKAGDTFSISYNSNAINDNRNGLALEALYQKGILDDGSLSFTRGYNLLSSDVSVEVNSAKIRTQSSQAVYEKAFGQFTQISGVNIQEEFSNIQMYQECYQATAQILQVAKSVFDTIIGIGR